MQKIRLLRLDGLRGRDAYAFARVRREQIEARTGNSAALSAYGWKRATAGPAFSGFSGYSVPGSLCAQAAGDNFLNGFYL